MALAARARSFAGSVGRDRREASGPRLVGGTGQGVRLLGDGAAWWLGAIACLMVVGAAAALGEGARTPDAARP